MTIDLNADVGEGYDDLPLFPLVSSINVACGGHAGDEETMARCVAAAMRLGVAVGAHPGYPDREHMGRRALEASDREVRAMIAEQVEALNAVTDRLGVRLAHVKPHGALYNQAAADPTLAASVAAAVRSLGGGIRLVGLAGSSIARAAELAGVPFIAEGFADRGYLRDGTLAPRGGPRAMIDDPARAAAQALALASGAPLETVDGGTIRVHADTICLHADTPGAMSLATATRRTLEGAGIRVASPT